MKQNIKSRLRIEFVDRAYELLFLDEKTAQLSKGRDAPWELINIEMHNSVLNGKNVNKTTGIFKYKDTSINKYAKVVKINNDMYIAKVKENLDDVNSGSILDWKYPHKLLNEGNIMLRFARNGQVRDEIIKILNSVYADNFKGQSLQKLIDILNEGFDAEYKLNQGFSLVNRVLNSNLSQKDIYEIVQIMLNNSLDLRSRKTSHMIEKSVLFVALGSKNVSEELIELLIHNGADFGERLFLGRSMHSGLYLRYNSSKDQKQRDRLVRVLGVLIKHGYTGNGIEEREREFFALGEKSVITKKVQKQIKSKTTSTKIKKI